MTEDETLRQIASRGLDLARMWERYVACASATPASPAIDMDRQTAWCNCTLLADEILMLAGMKSSDPK